MESVTQAKRPSILSNKPFREKPHVLIISEKWCDARPEFGETNSAHSFWGPLEANKLASFDLIHFDQYYRERKTSADAALIERVIQSKPDFIFLIWLWSEWEYNNPRLETLHFIREKLGVPICAWWGDTHAATIMSIANILSYYVDITFAGDSLSAYALGAERPEKFMPLPHPKDPRIFYDPEITRDVDVGFAGSIEDRPDRKNGLELLKQNGINVYQAGGQRETKLPIREYAQILMRSKIVVNFNGYEQRTGVINGRIFEATLCGALLLEPARSGARDVFEPMVEYVPYENEQDLLEKVKYYLAHDDERNAIAARGRDRAKRCYTGEQFWNTVFDTLRTKSKYDSLLSRLTLAQRHYNRRDFNAGLNILLPLINQFDGASSTYLWAAKALKELNNPHEAIKFLEQARKLSDFEGSLEMPEIYLELSKLYRQTNHFDQAFALMAPVINLGEKKAEFHIELSKILMGQEQLQMAAQVLADFIQKNPSQPEPIIALAEIYVKANDFANANSLLKLVRQIAPDNDEVLSECSKLYMAIGDTFEVSETKLQADKPSQAKAFWELIPQVVRLEYLGHYKQARNILRRFGQHSTDPRITEKLKSLDN